jgi:bacteriocin biosynthesis cyclodehydratase domain-containing protein
MVVSPGGRPCLACLFGTVADAPGECSVEGVLGPLVGMVGSLEAAEVMKLLLGVGTPLTGRMWMVDLFTGTTRVLTVPPRPDCPICGAGAAPSPSKG